MFGKVMHGRLFPKKNNFTYNIYYLSIPLSQIDKMPLPTERFSALSFYRADHGLCDGSSLERWARNILKDYNITNADGEIVLVCMPRVFGYVFNPVSFWLCYDKDQNIRAILCEVHNTFGERHTYLCANDDGSAIAMKKTLKGEKVFHVSPLLEREGHYEFKFDIKDNKFGVWIDYYAGNGDKQLITWLAGNLEEMSAKSLRKAFWRYPLITFKAITLIHWQALKLLIKGIKYISKPKQKDERVSATENLTKM